MFRNTKDQRLQELAWSVFESLEENCKISEGGYAGLRDVNDPGAGHVNSMPSYFLAETLKYLLLIFGPEDYVSLNDFVFTTEGHPLRIMKFRQGEDDPHIPYCVLQSQPPSPVPWTLLFLGSLIISVLTALVYLIRKTFLLFTSMISGPKRKAF